MLQNRVNPSGELIRTPARGGFMGNRGLIHNERKEITRAFRLKAWITCLLEFKNRHREVMTPGLYTELFFLDEATAFAAGHRPCAECRREAFNLFKKCWLEGNPEYGYDFNTPVRLIDDVLHAERIGQDGSKIIFEEAPGALPDGAMFRYNGDAYLVFANGISKWTPFGYEKKSLIVPGSVEVLTPRSVVNALRKGYPAQIKR